MHRTKYASVALVAALAACSGSNAPMGIDRGLPVSPGMSQPVAVPKVTAPRGYRVDVFVRGNKKRFNPDPIVKQGKYLYVAFQNATNPDGTGGDSTIVQYQNTGAVGRSVQVPGRCDGMRWNPYTNVMWLTVNEDANSALYTWDPSSGALAHYAFSSAKHGGGYDDLAFSNGKAFAAASNPTLSPHGINLGPALVSVTLKGTTAEVKTVIKGNADATDIPTGNTVRLNLTDPDSLSVTPTGDVLLVDQGDSEIVFVHNAAMGSQTVSRLSVGTQLDDTVYATETGGKLYVADSKKNVIYSVRGKLQSGGLYTEAPSDSKVAGFIGAIDPSTGIITPLITGFNSPTGLIFATDGKR